MGYRELIKQVQLKTGFSDAESEEALNHTVQSIAERLTADERKDFASQLPPELQEVAMSVQRTSEYENILENYMETYEIDEARAKKRILAAWEALKKTVSQGELEDVRTQLPKKTAELLH